uniref:T-box domain-containing protein n=1 Tax=Oreochromis aureus TaxID=47969 RepID=A0A668T8J7_OREAU
MNGQSFGPIHQVVQLPSLPKLTVYMYTCILLISFPDSSLNESMLSLAHPYQPSGIRMTLENADLWQSFHSIGTEMIITKHGRRMFPHCRVRVSGLQPFTNYVITMDIVLVDGFKYKWKKEQWEMAGAADPHPPCHTYMHPDSPAPGRHWMKQPLSFPKLKLTNNTLNQHGHVRQPPSFLFFFLYCSLHCI